MKIGVIGTGMVGATSAYALIMRGIGREIVLVDKNRERAEAEAADILHAVPFVKPMLIRAGEYEDLQAARVIVLAAGVNQKPGESRTALLRRNAEIFADVVPRAIRHAPEAIFIVATNPVDILTYQAAAVAAQSGIARHRVIGTGTALDTARFRSILGRRLQVDSNHVHANVLGEHGDSEVLAWSSASIAGLPLETIAQLQQVELGLEQREQVDDAVRNAAYHIIEGKGSTYYGVGGAISSMVDAIIHNRRAIFTVSSLTAQVGPVQDVTLSLPRIVGGGGVLGTLKTPLNEPEQQRLHHSAAKIRQGIETLGT